MRFWILFLLSFPAFSAPFVVADIPDVSCNQCVWGGFGGSLVTNVIVDPVRGNPSFGNRICLRDVSAAPVGTSSVVIACRDSTSVRGDSVAVPFSFVRLALPPEPPANIRVMP